MNRPLYSLLFYLALPIVLLRLLLRSRKAPAYRQRIAERFAFALPRFRQGGIWLHTVSVGESIAAAPLVRALQVSYPGLPITMTCMTPTGSERIQAMFGEQVQHCYMPYDLPCMARRFLRHLQPCLAIVMETELWPNHIEQCATMGIPVMLANGRLSERSARGYGRFPKLTAPMLARMSGLAVQTQIEAERFIALGARAEAIHVTGSIKFDLHIDNQLLEQAVGLKASWENTQRPIWMAASTHDGEDLPILRAHRQLLADFPDALLILVPRHPERFNAVYQLCIEQGLKTVRRSGYERVQAVHQVLLGDTMGEMLLLYALADVAFVGGSLVAHGGHNVLEPAALGKPVICGPHYFNFLDIVGQMQQAGALREVKDAGELAAAVEQLWHNQELYQAMQKAGYQVLHTNQGALDRLMQVVADTAKTLRG